MIEFRGLILLGIFAFVAALPSPNHPIPVEDFRNLEERVEDLFEAVAEIKHNLARQRNEVRQCTQQCQRNPPMQPEHASSSSEELLEPEFIDVHVEEPSILVDPVEQPNVNNEDPDLVGPLPGVLPSANEELLQSDSSERPNSEDEHSINVPHHPHHPHDPQDPHHHHHPHDLQDPHHHPHPHQPHRPNEVHHDSGNVDEDSGVKTVAPKPRSHKPSSKHMEAVCQMEADVEANLNIKKNLTITQKMPFSSLRIRGKLVGFPKERQPIHVMVLHRGSVERGQCSAAGEVLALEDIPGSEILGSVYIRSGSARIDIRNSVFELIGDRSIVGDSIVIKPKEEDSKPVACCTIVATKNIPSMSRSSFRFAR